MRTLTLLVVTLFVSLSLAQDSTKFDMVITMTKINGHTVMGTTQSDLTAIQTTQALIRDLNTKKNAGNKDEYDTKVSSLLKDLQRKGVRVYQ